MRLADNGDVARRRPPDGKTANRPPALKMGQLGETYRRIVVSAFTKHHQLLRDLLDIIAVSKSSLNFPRRQYANTPIRRYADTLPSRPVYACPKDNVRKMT